MSSENPGSAPTDNQAQIDYWNGKAGETWKRSQARLDRMLTGLTSIAIDAAAPSEGERAIDVGCGCGETTPPAAKSAAAAST